MVIKSASDITTPEFDYNLLVHSLQGYRHPRNKISSLLKSGEIIRVKKGIYVKGCGEPYSTPLLANLIYGPSYVSHDSALAFYGLIPERVHMITSVTLGRKKHFRTPVGEFVYEHLRPEMFDLGVRRHSVDEKRAFLIATPEKALADRIWRIEGLDTKERLENFLEHDLRFEVDTLKTFALARLRKIARAFESRTLELLVEIARERKGV